MRVLLCRGLSFNGLFSFPPDQHDKTSPSSTATRSATMTTLVSVQDQSSHPYCWRFRLLSRATRESPASLSGSISSS